MLFSWFFIILFTRFGSFPFGDPGVRRSGHVPDDHSFLYQYFFRPVLLGGDMGFFLLAKFPPRTRHEGGGRGWVKFLLKNPRWDLGWLDLPGGGGGW